MSRRHIRHQDDHAGVNLRFFGEFSEIGGIVGYQGQIVLYGVLKHVRVGLPGQAEADDVTRVVTCSTCDVAELQMQAFVDQKFQREASGFRHRWMGLPLSG